MFVVIFTLVGRLRSGSNLLVSLWGVVAISVIAENKIIDSFIYSLGYITIIHIIKRVLILHTP